MDREEFLKQIFHNGSEIEFRSSFFIGSAFNGDKEPSLVNLLMLNERYLSEEALCILDILENDEDFPYRNEFKEIKLKIAAFLNVQDAFPGVIYPDFSDNIEMSRNYFYYEALNLLREYFYCGLNNFLTATGPLIRNFLEFNIMQCYFYNKCEKENSFQSIKKYFDDGITSSFAKMVNETLPSSPFCKPVKTYLQAIYSGLSDSSSHAFLPEYSTRTAGYLHHQYSIGTVLFWQSLVSGLSAVLWTYYVTFPTLLNPKDVVRKFGFNIIPGLFITNDQYTVIEKSMSEADLKSFLRSSYIQQAITAKNELYDSYKDLTDEEISESWSEKKELTSFHEGYILVVTQMRGIQEMLAYSKSIEEMENENPFHPGMPTVKEIGSYSFAKKLHKRM